MIKKIKKKVLESQYSRFILQLAAGSMLAQAITIIVAPITTRLYTPKELGVYTMLLTIITIFGPILNGKYDLSIVSAKDEKEVIELMYGGFLFSLIFLFFITVGYSFYLAYNPEIYNDLGIFSYLIIGILLITSFINIFTGYNNRHKQYKVISSVYVVRTFIQNVFLVLFGFLKAGSIGLLVSQLLGSLFGLKKQSKPFAKHKTLLKDISFKRIRNTLYTYRNQPLYSLPAHFANSTSYSILNFFISGLFGLSALGYYSMSYRILGLPLSLISLNVSKVFFQRASEDARKHGDYSKILIKTTIFLSSIALPMSLVLIFIGPFIFELVFGDNWSKAGIFVQILAPMYGIRLVVSALTPALIISNKQKLELIIQGSFIICSIFSYILSKYMALDIYGFLTLISITYSIIYVIFYINIYKLSKGNIESSQ